MIPVISWYYYVFLEKCQLLRFIIMLVISKIVLNYVGKALLE